MSENENLPALTGSSNLPAFMQGQDQQVGKASMVDEKVEPFLHVVQAQSPEVSEETHKQGEFAVRPIGTNLGKSFLCVAVAFSKEFIQWGDRQKKAGIVARYSVNDLRNDKELAALAEWTEDAKGKSVPPVLSETRNFMVLALNENGDEFIAVPMILSLAGTSAKAGKRFVAGLKHFPGPICGQVFKVETFPTENDLGKWHTVSVTHERVLDGTGPNDETLFRQALATAKAADGEIATPSDTVAPENVA